MVGHGRSVTRPAGSPRSSAKPDSRQSERQAPVIAAGEILIDAVPHATDEVRALIGELDRTLSAECPPDQWHWLGAGCNLSVTCPLLPGAAERPCGRLWRRRRCFLTSPKSSACTCAMQHGVRALHRHCWRALSWKH